MTKEQALTHLKAERDRRKEMCDAYGIPKRERKLEAALNIAIESIQKELQEKLQENMDEMDR